MTARLASTTTRVLIREPTALSSRPFHLGNRPRAFMILETITRISAHAAGLSKLQTAGAIVDGPRYSAIG